VGQKARPPGRETWARFAHPTERRTILFFPGIESEHRQITGLGALQSSPDGFPGLKWSSELEHANKLAEGVTN
jgi:hypothetical protein